MNLEFREACEDDVLSLVKLLAEDVLGVKREDISTPLNIEYLDAFHSIEEDSNNELFVVESSGNLAGMLQLTYIPYLTHIGSWRCLIESVRVAKSYRGKGLGTEFINWAVSRARDKRCSIVQLTSDKQRVDAIKFYEELGFVATHEGFKLKL
ncbi:MAG: GNAT family N-acetyltransferase [Arenicella sp.]